MWQTVVSIVALIVAVVTFFLTWRRRRHLEQITSYLSIERDSDNHICLLLIKYDFLNLLFYEHPPQPPPPSNVSEEQLTAEQRAVINFGSLFLDYLEQIVILHLNGVLPKGIWPTWEKWIEEASRAPYFRWIWQGKREGYHPELILIVDKYIGIFQDKVGAPVVNVSQMND